MNRNVVVDLMRFLGIALIILAHVEPPNIIFQARTFDVPMMVFVSGMAYYCSGKSQVNLVHYAISRFKRLVLPVWIFFIFFFSIIFVFKITQFQNLLTFKSIVSTFMLSGFSYVWIIKIFLLVALLSPSLVFIANRVNGYLLTILSLIGLFLSLIISKIDYYHHGSLFFHLISDLILPSLSYGIVFMIGYRTLSFTKSELWFCFMVFLMVFLAYVGFNYLQDMKLYGPQVYKYPATLYYISYGMIMSFSLFIFLNIFQPLNLNKLIAFVSSNTIWIYLWHIPIVEYFKRYNTDINFIVKYIVAFGLAIVLSNIQYRLIMRIVKNNRKSFWASVFTG